MSRDRKDLERLAVLLEHLKGADKVALTLSRANHSTVDAIVGTAMLDHAIRRYESLYTTLYVDVHGTLPEKKQTGTRK